MHKTRNITGGEALDSLLAGAEVLYNAVSTTMGPRGNNVIFRKAGKHTVVTHDGVTVAKAVKLDDAAQDVGADLLREAAAKLDMTTGDGTTTVTVLTYHILKEAAKYIKQGANPMQLRLQLEKAQENVIKQLEENSFEVNNENTLVAVASVAAGDKEIGEIVGKAIYEAGKDTPIMLGFSDAQETYSEVIKGFKIDSGPASPYLLDGVRAELNGVKVIVCDAKLRNKEDVLPILRLISQIQPEDRRFLLVASDIAGDALSLMVINHLKQFAGVAVTRVPAYISSPSEYLQDLAIATGAQVLSNNTGHTIGEPTLEDFGSAERVIIEPGETIIIDGHPNQEDFDEHIKSLKEFKAKDKITKQFMKDRLQTLEQKVVNIRVGGQSETDAEERHYRFEDAVGASRSALRKGVIGGGGTALYSVKVTDGILAEALKVPLRVVLQNAGFEVPNGIKTGFGVDVMHPEDGVVDLVERGILDPAESEIESVKTAVAVAGLLMTSGAMIVDEETGNESKTPEQFSLS